MSVKREREAILGHHSIFLKDFFLVFLVFFVFLKEKAVEKSIF